MLMIGGEARTPQQEGNGISAYDLTSSQAVLMIE